MPNRIRRALLVDDDEWARRRGPARCGFTQVQIESSAMQARRLIATASQYDLYVIDVGIWATYGGGVGDGLSVAELVRARWPKAAIAIWSSSNHRASADRLGARFASKLDGMEALFRAVGQARGT